MRTANIVSVLAFLWSGLALAQQTTGNIAGTVTDPSGASIAGATVRAVSELTGDTHEMKSGATGDYLIPALPVGRYRVEVEASGFKKILRSGITLDVGQSARVDARMEIGQAGQEVVVQGDAPLVDTREMQVGAVVDDKRIVDLPLNGRNVYALATLLPGISGSPQLPQQPDVAEGTRFNVNGARVLQTTFLLDGGLNIAPDRNGGMMTPNPDSVEEFRLITSNYNAEYGRSAGGVVTVVTKSGTNQFHGSLYEFLRNQAFDARSFFAPSVSPLKRNQFGGTVGGPVVHDKLFFFFSYQGDRLDQGNFLNTARTPTAAQRAGDFSAVAAAQRPKDPTTGQPFPNGIIPANRLDPVASNILKLIALPNTPDGRVQATRSTIQNDDQYFGKGDWQPLTKHRISAGLFFIRANDRYPFSNSSNISNIPDYAPSTDSPNQTNVTLNETYTIRPNLLNQFTFNYAYARSALTALNTLSWQDFGSQFVPGQTPAYPPRFTVSGGWNGGNNGESLEEDSLYSFSDSLTWVHGAHSIKAGGSLSLLHLDYYDKFRLGGIISISGAFTGNAFADFETGRADSMLVGNGNIDHLRSQNWGGFVQDTWKLSRKVTVNLGLRYEIFTPYTETSNHLGNYVPGQQSTIFPNAPLDLVYPGDKGVPNGTVPTDYNNWAPRVGIAFDPQGDGKTAIRAGYGMFYSVNFAGFYQVTANSQPYEDNITIFGTPSFVNPFGNAGGNPFPAPKNLFITPITVQWQDQHNRTPYVQQYNFTVQRQLLRDLSLDVGYVGNVSRKLQEMRDYNQPIFIPGQSTAANVNQRRPIQPNVLGGIAQVLNGANASYNGLQTSLRQRFAHGLTVLANYTYSKSIDLQSADSQDNSTIMFVDSNRLSLDRGVAAFDTRHVFNLSFLYQTPSFKHWGFVGQRLLGDWEINAIARYSSGLPFNVTSGVDTNLNGQNNDRPNTIGDPYLDTSRPKNDLLRQYFNPKAFAPAAQGTLGTEGRNIFYGKGSQNWDVSFFKTFRIYERHQLQFRAELFNFFNHANFAPPVSVLSNPNVGQLLTSGPGRIVQFALKYSF